MKFLIPPTAWTFEFATAITASNKIFIFTFHAIFQLQNIIILFSSKISFNMRLKLRNLI